MSTVTIDGASENAAQALTMSPSKVSTFRSCPQAFKFRYIDRLPSKPTVEAARGTLVHAVLEHLFTLDPSQRTASSAVQLVPETWSRLQQESDEFVALFADVNDQDKQAWMDTVEAALGVYFELEDPTRLQPELTETQIEAVLDSGVTLRGIIDRVDRAPGGQVRIVDYKTGKAPREGFEQSAMFQMRLYALLWWINHNELPTQLMLVYLGNKQTIRYTPTEADLAATARILNALHATITTAISTGAWPARPSKLCGWCSFQAVCPAKQPADPAGRPLAI